MAVVAHRIGIVASAVFVFGGGGCESAAPAPARRVILVTCDTLRADHLGCFGYDRPTSPNLDAFAGDAVRFENAWSSAPLTGPALASLLTGKPPDEVGATPTNRELIPEGVDTLAEVVSRAGIATAAFVSNGVLRRPPADQGSIGLQQGFDTFDDEMLTKEANRDLVERTAPACTDAVLAWLAARKAAREDRFFLWVHYQDPHGPYLPPPDVAARFARTPPHGDELPAGGNNSGKDQIPRYQVVGAERRPSAYVDRYDAEIRHFDEHLGRLFAWLQANGMWEDSLVVFTADHGESLGDHGYWFCHGETLNRELVRVPLVVRFPRALRESPAPPLGGRSREAALVTHLDAWPTILHALGLPPRANRGASLLAPAVPADRVAAQFLGPLRNPGRRLGITDGTWRLVIVSTDAPRLFDLSRDPGELRDVAAEYPDVVERLKKRYVAYMADGATGEIQGTRRKLDAAGTRALKGLGYTDGDDDGR